MTEYTQEEAVFRMNEMGKAGRPFLFIIDYKRDLRGESGRDRSL